MFIHSINVATLTGCLWCGSFNIEVTVTVVRVEVRVTLSIYVALGPCRYMEDLLKLDASRPRTSPFKCHVCNYSKLSYSGRKGQKSGYPPRLVFQILHSLWNQI